MKALGKGSIASLVKVGLTIAWYVLWACLAALVLAAVGYAALQVLIGAGVVDASILEGGDSRIRVGAGQNSDFEFTTGAGAAWPIVVPALIIGAVVIVGGLIIVGRLRRLFDSFTSGEPFRRENADHLRVIWITMLAMEIARYALLAVIGAVVVTLGAPDGAEANFNVSVDFSTWMSIAILIVLAEVFREGARMKEEQELTI